MKTIVFIHTAKGARYSERIARSVKWIGKTKYGDENAFQSILIPADAVEVSNCLELFADAPERVIVHARAAHPHAPWMSVLNEYEGIGVRVINRTSALVLTSNKGMCWNELHHAGIPQPFSEMVWREDFADEAPDLAEELSRMGSEYAIVKPAVSQGQGKYVKKVRLEDLTSKCLVGMPGNPVLVQSYVDVAAIFRVFVINGEPLSFVTADRTEWHPDPEDWKVSVCLNKDQRIGPARNKEITDIAVKAQKAVGGEISFVDVFMDKEGKCVLSEINTACSLFIHERLAKMWEYKDWNIHYRIAKYLVSQFK